MTESLYIHFVYLWVRAMIDDISSIMWLAYSGRINGASITFCFEDSVKLNELFYSNEKIAYFPVRYVENKDELIGEDYSLIGHIKNQKFADEKEYRFLIKKGLDRRFESPLSKY